MNREEKRATTCESSMATTAARLSADAQPQSALSELAPEALRSYTRKKQAVARVVHQLADVLRGAGDEPGEKAAHELLVKLAEDRFTLAVVGQFKRGKSSLINAIVGREVLPTGVLPLTSAITILRHGVRERLVVHFTGSHLTHEAPLAELPEFVAESGNPGNRRRVEAVYLELPVRFLRRGLEFVDTPGIGSSIEANTRTTLSFIPRCDAVLFVTSVEAPLTAAEGEFLRMIHQHVRKVFFVLNKTDLLATSEIEQVVIYARQTLGREMAADVVRVFPLSCRQALQGAAGEAPECAGLPDLQQALAAFLTGESAATLLTSVIDKTRHLCAAALAEPAGATAPELAALDRRLAALGAGQLPAVDEVLRGSGPQSAVEIVPVLAQPPDVEPTADADLLAALRTRGCPVCDRLENAAFEFFRHYQYGLATQPRVQQNFAQTRGFCTLHSWQLATIMSPQSVSSGISALVERTASELAELGSAESVSGQRANGISTRATDCEVCRLLESTERVFLGRVAQFVTSEAGQRAYSASYGLCLRHLDGLLAAVPSQPARRFLLREAAQRFDELGEDLRAYALKREALRSGLLSGDEDDAHRRALVHLFGDKRLCQPWTE
jgi:GTP-binding protein EngB required for normal cell division